MPHRKYIPVLIAWVLNAIKLNYCRKRHIDNFIANRQHLIQSHYLRE